MLANPQTSWKHLFIVCLVVLILSTAFFLYPNDPSPYSPVAIKEPSERNESCKSEISVMAYTLGSIVEDGKTIQTATFRINPGNRKLKSIRYWSEESSSCGSIDIPYSEFITIPAPLDGFSYFMFTDENNSQSAIYVETTFPPFQCGPLTL